MYTVIKNFKIDKQKDFAKLSADCLIELEKAEDEWQIGRKFPKCLETIVENKISFDSYDLYNIYTLNVRNYSKVTDHKKIWKLAGFEKAGLFENYYDGDNGRIYFGISIGLFKCESNHLVDNISIFIPKGDILETQDIFELFAKNHFDINLDRIKQHSILSSLQKLEKNSIVIYKSFDDNSLSIYGEHVEKIFNADCLPITEIIER